MIARSWSECVELYAADEKTWRLSSEERARDWADGRCGQCAGTFADHVPLAPVITADAVLATPYPPVDPLVSGYLRGEALRSQLSDEQWRTLAGLVHLIPDDYSADVTPGGVR